MSSGVRTALLSVAALVVGGLVLLGAHRIVERQRTVDEINRIRDEIYRTRLASDRCRSSLQTSEAALRSLGTTIDSLRGEVGSYEIAGGRVLQSQYDDYMAVFDEYNDSVRVWEGRERRLRSAETSCRATIQHHNALTDTLQTVLSEAGIEAG